MIIPDSITPVVGWKSWKVNDDGYLYSPTYQVTWPVGARLEAKCDPLNRIFVAGWGHAGQFPEWKWVWEAVSPSGDVVTLREVYPSELEQSLYSRVSTPIAQPKTPLIFPSGWEVRASPMPPAPKRKKTHGELSPDETCHCGIYAAELFDALRYAERPSVIGRIAGWGHVIEGDKGFRAQYAYPKEIYVVGYTWKKRRDLARVLRCYDVPVASVSTVVEAQAKSQKELVAA